RRGRRSRFCAVQLVLDAGLVVDDVVVVGRLRALLELPAALVIDGQRLVLDAAGTDERLPDLVGLDGVVNDVVVVLGDVSAADELPRLRPERAPGPDLPRRRVGSRCFWGYVRQ